MVFSSPIFLFIFLPLFLIIYYLIPLSWKSFWILLSSYIFYSWWRLDFTLLLIFITIIAYFFALFIENSKNEVIKFRLLFLAVLVNLIILGYFKYANFGIESFNSVLKSVSIDEIAWTSVVLPIGLSFFIFHAISYLVDIYRKTAKPAQNIIEFAAFVALFPHLIAGPVLRYHLLADQFKNRQHSWLMFSSGINRFMIGFAKKIMIADTLAPLANAVFLLPSPTFLDSWLGLIAYTLQIYFDFSGYSDMAIGLASMIGFKFPENFFHPYLSPSITVFWQRWHISLSSWLREYLYIPLGGNRLGSARTYINLLVTMILGGLWHGANWTFILWGAWHGFWLALERFMNGKFKPIHPVFAIPKTLFLVMIGWIFFRSESVETIKLMLSGILGLQGFTISDHLAFQITGMQTLTILLGVLVIFLSKTLIWNKFSAKLIIFLPIIFLISILKMLSQQYSPFLYFQF